LVSGLPDPRLEDPLAGRPVTPTGQGIPCPQVPSSDEGVIRETPEDDVPGEGPEFGERYRRLDDISGEATLPVVGTEGAHLKPGTEVFRCGSSVQRLVELESPHSSSEEKLDYGEGEEDEEEVAIHREGQEDAVAPTSEEREESSQPESVQVPSSDPYSFD
jgi:hypothetical protein